MRKMFKSGFLQLFVTGFALGVMAMLTLQPAAASRILGHAAIAAAPASR